MTNNQIANKKVEEEIRSNKEKEEIAKGELEEKKKAGKFQRGFGAVHDTLKTLAGLHKTKGNHPQWYNADPQLVKDVANVSFNNPLGNQVKLPFSNATTSIPGICVLTYMPAIGSVGSNGNDSANIAAQSLYAYVRHANSGSRNYEANDLMMYLLAAGELISFHTWMCRLYSLITTSKSHNRYYVNAMIEANGVDPNDLRNNIANFRAYINSFAVRANSFFIPKDLSLFERRIWMNGSIFKDHPIKKSQEYMFVPLNFLAYDDVNGKLVEYPESGITIPNMNVRFNPYASTKNTVIQIMTRGNYLLNSMLNSEDAGIMSGDILKAYGESRMYYLPSLSEDYHIESVYDEDALMQITNAVAIGTDYTGQNSFNIYQDSANGKILQGVAYYEPDDQNSTVPIGYGIRTTLGYSALSDEMITGNNILNFYKDTITPDEVMVSTRLMISLTKGAIGDVQHRNNTYLIKSVGSEYIIEINYISLNANATSSVIAGGILVDIEDYTLNKAFAFMAMATKFKWHPNMYIFGDDITTDKVLSGFREYANYASISDSVLDNLNYVALLSEFGIPKLGLTVRKR